jgi:shikimate kinase
MGAGKSTIGRALAKELKRDFFDSDLEVENRTGADISWIFDIEGEKGFRLREAKVVDELTRKNEIVLATGGGVVVTPENRSALSGRGTVIYLRTNLEQQYLRTRRDSKRPLLQTLNVQERIDELWAQREPYYIELADFTFDTDHLAVKTVTQQILDALYGN